MIFMIMITYNPLKSPCFSAADLVIKKQKASHSIKCLGRNPLIIELPHAQKDAIGLRVSSLTARLYHSQRVWFSE